METRWTLSTLPAKSMGQDERTTRPFLGQWRKHLSSWTAEPEFWRQPTKDILGSRETTRLSSDRLFKLDQELAGGPGFMTRAPLGSDAGRQSLAHDV